MLEKNMAILMADLSGYTAMTEVHGSRHAAHIIRKYLQLVDNAIGGNARLLERVGDQVVIVSDNPDDLATTALNLLEYSRAIDHFLPIHAGLHFGKILEQEGSFFGTAMNLTARITNKAQDGKILCSSDFVNALANVNRYKIYTSGIFRFKNLSFPVELFELVPKDLFDRLDIDPICNMQVNTKENPIKFFDKDQVYHFCSKECLITYQTKEAVLAD